MTESGFGRRASEALKGYPPAQAAQVQIGRALWTTTACWEYRVLLAASLRVLCVLPASASVCTRLMRSADTHAAVHSRELAQPNCVLCVLCYAKHAAWKHRARFWQEDGR